MAKIVCDCKGSPSGDYQEKLYGKGVKIGTPKLVTQGRTPEFTCTVCGNKTTKEVK